MGWIDDVRQAPVARAVAGLGLAARTAHGRATFGPCPACGATRRGGSDPRPPVADLGRAWHCHACQAKGGALEVAAASIGADLRAGSADWPRLRETCASLGLCEYAHAPGEAKKAPTIARAPEPPPAPPERLPASQVAALWDAAWPCDAGAAAGWWAARSARDGWRGDPVARVARARSLSVARVCPPGVCEVGDTIIAPPDWARVGRVTWGEGWPLLLPVYDARGELVALRARRCAWTPDGEPKGPHRWTGESWVPQPGPDAKEVSPIGGGCRGAVYADPAAVSVLRGGGAFRAGDPVLCGRDWSPGSVVWSGRAVIVEGGPDFLRASTADGRLRLAKSGEFYEVDAVFGVWQGAWPADGPGFDIAATLRHATLVQISTDADGPGEKYAAAIAATLDRFTIPNRRKP
jgi:hypothetical protein